MTDLYQDALNVLHAALAERDRLQAGLDALDAGISKINDQLGGPIHIDNTEPGHALLVVNDVDSTNSNAACLVSHNPSDTTLGVRGRETGRGTIKATNERVDGKPNANAAVLSLVAAATGIEQTECQGIFLDAPGQGTKGKLLNVRNKGVEVFVVNADGSLRLGAGPGAVTLRVAAGRLIAATADGETVLT